MQANLEVFFGIGPIVDPRLLTAARALSTSSAAELKGVQLERLASLGGKPVLSAASEVRPFLNILVGRNHAAQWNAARCCSRCSCMLLQHCA